MVKKIIKLFRNPRKYASLLSKSVLQKLSYPLRRSSFYLQGQMDINPASKWHNPEFVSRTGGYFPTTDRTGREIVELEPWDTTRKDMLVLLLRQIIESGTAGDFAELGVYRGSTAKLIHYYVPERRLYLFDTFEGFTTRGAGAELRNTGTAISDKHFADTSLKGVQLYVNPKNDNVIFCKGYFPESLPAELSDHTFAFVHLDADLYEPIIEGLRFFYPRLVSGGILVIHDYNAWIGARHAVDDYFQDKLESPIPMPDKSGSAVVVKVSPVSMGK